MPSWCRTSPRKLTSFGCGALLGVPLFFLAKPHMSISTAALLMVLSMLPFFLLAMYERNGQPLEKILYQLIQSRFIRPKKRPYRTDNFYAAVERQTNLDKEVKIRANNVMLSGPDKSKNKSFLHTQKKTALLKLRKTAYSGGEVCGDFGELSNIRRIWC
ncbi:MAG: PrgI family protein [Clostridiaceae bacterium]|nr:PrgI family protein [Clostridiaceae bacterium]